MRNLLLTLALVPSLALTAQTSMFEPCRQTDLRLPSVPLVMNDPYISIWTPYDKITDGLPQHWTGAEKTLLGLLRVDGTTYKFMGSEKAHVFKAIVPMGDAGAWLAKVSYTAQGNNNWTRTDFDESPWLTQEGAFGSPNEYPDIRTSWTDLNSDIYIRRHFALTQAEYDALQDVEVYILFSHDDVCQVYLNGRLVTQTGETWVQREECKLSSRQRKTFLQVGDNVIGYHVHNTTGGANADIGLFKDTKKSSGEILTATQNGMAKVLATNTYYNLTCGPVDLDLVFTAPMLMDDLGLMSTPINFISYQVRSADGRRHDVKLLLTASPLIASNEERQPMETRKMNVGGVEYVRTGTIDQPILAKKGDNISIDWGYLYIPNVNGDVAIGKEAAIRSNFVSNGTLATGTDVVRSYGDATSVTLAYYHDFGKVAEGRIYAMIGYDEVHDIQYMYRRYKALWARGGKVSIFDAFNKLRQDYSAIMDKCRQTDKMIYDDGVKAGNKHYAEILSASYRQVMAAHKIFRDEDGKQLFFSKENNSNGCVNTVDLTYPSAPLFLCYNPELEKGMMTSILDYSLSGRWTKPFAAHDIGTYPVADGQVYGGDMPLEESGNMLTLCAQIAMTEGNADYAKPYWDILKTWADYLVENGQDPANQFCTDDFAGHWAHNANLSIKAIMGVAAFAELAKLRGDNATYNEYNAKAKHMAQVWERTDAEGDHYRLAFESPDTWSQKCNLVWDRLWNTGIFPEEVIDTEIKYYLKKQNRYGLPLDCRANYTKSDWIMWTASMARDKKTFLEFVEPIYAYINETESRVPISDWHDTNTGRWVGFRARSVIGGYWMRVLVDKKARVKKLNKK